MKSSPWIESSPRCDEPQSDVAHSRDVFLSDVLRGLSAEPKYLDSKYLYDAAGSQLFDRICEQPEYYLTRVESRLMRSHAKSMAEAIGSQAVIVELGSGSSLKTRILLDHLHEARAYVPVDISEEHLFATVQTLHRRYPRLEIEPVVADFTEAFELPERYLRERVALYFPGSTIGNLEQRPAVKLLRNLAALQIEESVGLLIGFDLVKDRSILEPAYNDAAGVSAAFTLNLLHRMNRELDADFEVEHFEHVAFFNAVHSRIEIYLQSLRRQRVDIAGHVFEFAAGQRVRTEYSHKYTLDQFTRLASSAGFQVQQTWTDPRNYFAVMYLTAN